MTEEEAIQDRQNRSDVLMSDYLEEMLNCMFLQYAASEKIKKDIPKGLAMIQAVDAMRKTLEETKTAMEAALSEEEIKASRNRIGYYKTLFSQTCDSVIASNSKYFDIPARPQGAEYACDEKFCLEDVHLVAQFYFPEIYDSAA